MTATTDSDRSLHDALFSPRSVALVGASDNPTKTTARPLEYLRQAGWAGEIFPVNAVREMVLGAKAWRSVRDLPSVPDHAYVMAAADAAVEVTRECAEIGVPVVSIMADGFLETDPGGPARRAALLEVVRTSGTRVLGPSSLGVANLHEDLTLTANAAFAESDLPAGSIFVASQSGSAIGALVSRGKDMGIGFHALVSTGAELDLTLGEICLASIDDPRIQSYALFMENITGADDLRAFARAAASRGKPVLVYKLGRSDAGAELAVSHTGALAGDDALAGALFDDLGLGRVTTFEALLEGQLLARSVPLTERANRRPRVCVVSTTGGGGAMAVDCLALQGAVLQAPAPETVARLAEIGISAGHGALIDLTLAGTRYDVMKGALDIVLSASEFDAVVAVPGSSARFHPELAVKPIADSVGSATPLAAFVMPAAPEALRLLREAGVSAFRTPESCADALLAAFRRRQPTKVSGVARPPDGDSVVLDEQASYEVLEQLGIPHAAYAVVDAGEDVADLPVRSPAVVKILAADSPHKSDIGGVVLGVQTAEDLRAAQRQITAAVRERAPGVQVDRFLVQEMVQGIGEVLVGFRHDVHAGPVVLLAAGGVLAELHKDRSVRTAPVDLAMAHEMIEEVVSLRAMAGYRGAQRGDLDALAAAVVAMSNGGGISGGAVLEAEANPVMVLAEGHGVVAVDALVRVATPATVPA
jgi:acyl-CoA synthetase (NDP forming)